MYSQDTRTHTHTHTRLNYFVFIPRRRDEYNYCIIHRENSDRVRVIRKSIRVFAQRIYTSLSPRKNAFYYAKRRLMIKFEYYNRRRLQISKKPAKRASAAYIRVLIIRYVRHTPTTRPTVLLNIPSSSPIIFCKVSVSGGFKESKPRYDIFYKNYQIRAKIVSVWNS